MRNSWNINVSYVSKKAAKFLYLLHRHMYTCRVSSKQKAFRELVIPVPDYVSTVWSPHTNKNSTALEQIQNCCAHWICGSRFCLRTYRRSKSSEECCAELFWPSLSTQRKYLSLTMIYDIIMFPYILVITSLSPLPQPGPIHCPFYANNPPLTLLIHFW